jgi:hypothetical protein
MDKLAKRLREDAATIDAEISAQLDSRIQASLAAIEPETVRRQRKPRRRPVSFWLASSLTGVVSRTVADNTMPPIEIPVLDLDVEAATLTGPLARELEDLQADLKKAEEVMRGDVRIDF